MSDLLTVRNVTKHFSMSSGLQRLLSRENPVLHAVDGVTLEVNSVETLGLAGESGCGKTTLARLITRLETPTSGEIVFGGEDTSHVQGNQLRRFYKNVQMVFQDPLASLNPRKNVEQIIGRSLAIQEGMRGAGLRSRILELLEDVDLKPAREYIQRYPHELSGGEKQRVVIARAVSLRPKLVVADEPVASLDMSIRGKILTLMMDLQKRYDVSYILITHDLRVLRSMCDRIAIMYLGLIVEKAITTELFRHPYHPYTKALMSAELIPDPASARGARGLVIEGEVPSPIRPPSGCRFHTRCPYKRERCGSETPVFEEVGSGHFVSCHFWKEIEDKEGR